MGRKPLIFYKHANLEAMILTALEILINGKESILLYSKLLFFFF